MNVLNIHFKKSEKITGTTKKKQFTFPKCRDKQKPGWKLSLYMCIYLEDFRNTIFILCIFHFHIIIHSLLCLEINWWKENAIFVFNNRDIYSHIAKKIQTFELKIPKRSQTLKSKGNRNINISSSSNYKSS